MSNKPSSNEQGFTLVELLIAIALCGLIISALVAGFITTMRGTASAHDRFVASNGNHSLATYFTSDVQSANATTVSTDTTADSGCYTTDSGTTNVVRLQWFEKPTTTDLKAFSVSYRTRKVGSEWQLVRYACSGSGTSTTPGTILGAAIPTSQVMVSDLYDPTATPSHPTVAVIVGRVVSLTVFSAIAQDETSPYEYTVSADLRSLSGGTTTTTTSSSTTSTSTSTSTSTTTSSTTTTTTTASTATKLGLVSCVKSDGTTVSCAGPITLAKDQWVDISVRLLDASGNAVNATSTLSVPVSLTQTGNSFEVTSPVTIAAGTSQSSGPFRLTHKNNGGSGTVTASYGSLTPASVAVS